MSITGSTDTLRMEGVVAVAVAAAAAVRARDPATAAAV